MLASVLDGAKTAYLAVRGFATPAKTRLTWTMPKHVAPVSAVVFFKDSRRVVTGSDHIARIWDVEKGALVAGPFEGHWSGPITCPVAVSPDDRRVASGSSADIMIWDVDEQKVLGPLVKHQDTVRSLCFSPDGKRLASASLDGTVVIWDAETGAVLSTLQCNVGMVLCVAFSPDGLKLASGTLRNILVWDTNNAKLLFDIEAHEDWVSSIVWSPDGQQLVSASRDKTIKFWDSANGTQIGQPCTGHTCNIRSLAISSDGSFIGTASDDHTVHLWNTKSHLQIGQALKHATYVFCVAISPSGELLVSGDSDGNLQLWSIESTLSTAFETDPSYFAHRSKVKLDQRLYAEALSDAEKVIELDPSSHLGYDLKYTVLHGAQRYDDALEAFTFMLSKLDDAPNPRIRQLRQQYISPSEVEDAIRRAIHAQLENAPLRLINTATGHICNRNAQINAVTESIEYKELLHSLVTHAPLQTERIKEAVIKYFSWVMLSHRWETKEPLLHDIQDKVIYDLDPVGTVVKLQKFCQVACDAGHRWAWSDTCCIDQNNNVEVQQSVNSMFVWYHHSALTIVYLSDVPPWSESGALANSIWNTRGWTVQEFLAPKILLFYQVDWTPYLDDRSRNHKESVTIMRELERSTGINARALAAFHPGMRHAREKLRWASTRVTTLQEDIAYSLFGIFGVHLPVIYAEKRQNALGRLLQEIIAHSGDITALDWVGQSSTFNSCLPADIFSYKALPWTVQSLSEDEIQNSVSTLRNNVVAVESASKLYTTLENFGIPRFANSRLQLPCIAFPLTEVRRSTGRDEDKCFTYEVKAHGLQDLLVTTEDKLIQFSPARRTRQTFLLIRPWNRYDLELVDSTNESRSMDDWPDEPGDDELVTRGLRLLVRLAHPFGALLLAQQRGGEYKRIASDNNIIAQVRDMASVDHLNNVRMLEIL
ncbi:WD40-repeat-containing domain protein [Suillus discolor]|uniref:WD40-repeat-containing domain protein n=1 Tax=Suillus discolor TaxID=1912936 RepID=A0A9P7JM25_9AGAM|nr:WD40-repeat-containing domain protein [Suillus discolor]KAG2087804.1 WD40-repeat-containing domain protein [Suillus discolor]